MQRVAIAQMITPDPGLDNSAWHWSAYPSRVIDQAYVVKITKACGCGQRIVPAAAQDYEVIVHRQPTHKEPSGTIDLRAPRPGVAGLAQLLPVLRSRSDHLPRWRADQVASTIM